MTDIKKRLVFYFYAPHSEFPELYEFHLKCLKKFCTDIFDEMIFIIAIDELSDFSVLNDYGTRINKAIPGRIHFELVKNDPILREGKYYKKYIIDKLDEYDGLTFFGHGKGISDLQHKEFYSKDADESEFVNDIYEWIYAMYYFNFHWIDRVEHYLCSDKKYIFYGSIPTLQNNNLCERYRWIYSGSFYWINCNRLNYALNQWKTVETYKQLEPRMIAEQYPGQMVPINFAATCMGGVERDVAFFDYRYVNRHIKFQCESSKMYGDFINDYSEFMRKDRPDVRMYIDTHPDEFIKDDTKIEWSDYFDHIYCIHHTPYSDRLPIITKELERVGILKSNIFTFHYTWNSPVYDELAKSSRYNKTNGIKYLKVGLAQYSIHKEAKELGYKKILILEDDIVFAKSISDIKRVLDRTPKDSDLVLYDNIFEHGTCDKKVAEEYKKYIEDDNNKLNGEFVSYSTGFLFGSCYLADEKVFKCVTDIFEHKFGANDSIFNSTITDKYEIKKSAALHNIAIQNPNVQSKEVNALDKKRYELVKGLDLKKYEI